MPGRGGAREIPCVSPPSPVFSLSMALSSAIFYLSLCPAALHADAVSHTALGRRAPCTSLVRATPSALAMCNAMPTH